MVIGGVDLAALGSELAHHTQRERHPRAGGQHLHGSILLSKTAESGEARARAAYVTESPDLGLVTLHGYLRTVERVADSTRPKSR